MASVPLCPLDLTHMPGGTLLQVVLVMSLMSPWVLEKQGWAVGGQGEVLPVLTELVPTSWRRLGGCREMMQSWEMPISVPAPRNDTPVGRSRR